MKRIAAAVLAAIMILVCLTSCSVNTKKIKDGDSVIGIITPENSTEEYAETMRIQEKYGADKIAVETFKATGVSATSAIYEAAERLLSTNNIKAIIFAKGVEGTADAIKAIKAAKPDVECIDVNPDELDYFVSATADLTISVGVSESCTSMVAAAKKAGMDTVVYMVPDKYLRNQSIVKQGEELKKACEDKKIDYVEHVYQTYTNEIDIVRGSAKGAVVSCIEQYGEDTAFYSASCLVTDTIIKTASENGAGYIYGNCNCPNHHYVTAFDVDKGENYSQLIENVRAAVDKDAAKRLCVIESSPESVMLKTALGYAVAYCNGSIDTSAEFDEAAFKSAIKTALKDEAIDDMEFAASEKYGNVINVGFPVTTL